MKLTPDLASRMANIALAHTVREFPHKLDHVWNDASDGTRPSAQHPIFYGSFDWHSCVHGYWLLLRLLRRFPDLPEAPAIRARADDVFTPAKVAGELAYLSRPNSGGFERPYGWAWLLALHGEAALHDAGWGAALEPLARAFAVRFTTFLPVQTYAIRNGSHANTAFALVLAHDCAKTHDTPLAALMTFISIPPTTVGVFLPGALLVGNGFGFHADVQTIRDMLDSGASFGDWATWLFSDAAPSLVLGLLVIASVAAVAGFLLATLTWRIVVARKWTRRPARRKVLHPAE